MSVLAFSPSGEHVVSLAADEQTLRWWLAGSHGFFGFLGLQGSCLHLSNIEKPLSTEDGAVLGIEWTSPTDVTLTCNRKRIGAYSRPGS